MTSDIAKIEDFFGARFDFEPTAAQRATLCHFDGFVHWTVYLDIELRSLWFIADSDFRHGPLPVIEIGVCYSSILIDEALGIGPVLQIQPENVRYEVGIWLTKTAEGRISLVTNLGRAPLS